MHMSTSYRILRLMSRASMLSCSMVVVVWLFAWAIGMVSMAFLGALLGIVVIYALDLARYQAFNIPTSIWLHDVRRLTVAASTFMFVMAALTAVRTNTPWPLLTVFIIVGICVTVYRDSFRMKNEDPAETVLAQSGDIFRSPHLDFIILPMVKIWLKIWAAVLLGSTISVLIGYFSHPRETNYGSGVGLVVVIMVIATKEIYKSLDNWVAAGYRRINWLSVQSALIIAQIPVGLCAGFYLKLIGAAPSLAFLALAPATMSWIFLAASLSKRWKQFFSIVHLFGVAALWVALFAAEPCRPYFIAAMVVSTAVSIWVAYRNVINREIESEKSDNVLGTST